MLKTVIMIGMMLAAILSLVGCGQTYGTPTTIFNVLVSPEQGVVYMIPEPVWIKNNRIAMLEDTEKMEVWRKGKTPISMEAKVDLPYVFVVYHNGQYTTSVTKKMSRDSKTLEINYE